MNTRLEQIQSRANKATVGPWYAGRGATADGTEFVETYGQKAEFLALSLNSGRSQLWLVDNGSVIPAVSGDGPKAEANAEFIANAREDVPYLLALVREQAAQIEQANALVLKIDSMLTERAVTLAGTSMRMLEQGFLPKSERDPDYDHETSMRYTAYADESSRASTLTRQLIRAAREEPK